MLTEELEKSAKVLGLELNEEKCAFYRNKNGEQEHENEEPPDTNI